MKKLLTMLCAVALVFCTVGIAQATTYYEEYSGHQYVGEGQRYNFGFDFLFTNDVFGVGTNSSLDLVEDAAAGPFAHFGSGNLHVRLYSVDRAWEKIAIRLIAWNIDMNPLATFNLDPGWVDIQDPRYWNFHHALTPTEIAAFDQEGWGNVRIGALPTGHPNYNDFAIKRVAMDVTTVESVPEPATMALFGIGLVGLVGAGARRRFKKEKTQ